MSKIKDKWLVPIAFANVYIIWGLTFIAISFGLQGFPPFILSGLRFLVAGLILYAFLRYKGERANSFLNWRKNAITGIFILTGGTGLVGWSEQYVTASEAAIAIATGPFWFIAHEVINSNQLIGLFIILFGVLLTNMTKYFKLSNRTKVKIRQSLRIMVQIRQAYKPLTQF